MLSMIRQWRFAKGLSGKLIRLLVIQLMAISIAAMLGVYAAAQVLEKVLVREALEGEAEHFWALRAENPQQSLPDTNNMTGYHSIDGQVTHLPPGLQPLVPGFYRVSLHDDVRSVVHVSEHNSERLYLVFDQVHVSNLALLFGVAPLTAVLVVIYILVWVGFIRTNQAISPLVSLSTKLESFDFRSHRVSDLDLSELEQESDSEITILVQAFKDFAERMDAMIQRERNFTRNASHELRTPVAVLRANLDLLRSREHDSQSRADITERMRRTVRDMEALLETLLLLARESESRLQWGVVSLNEIVAYQLDLAGKAHAREGVRACMSQRCELQTSAPEKVLAIVFANLLRNAFTYTEQGEVRVEVLKHAIAIQDTGCGMSETDLNRAFEPFYRGQGVATEGYGLGLALVNRLCQRFAWRVEVDSELNAGTRITVHFPKSKVLPIEDLD